MHIFTVRGLFHSFQWIVDSPTEIETRVFFCGKNYDEHFVRKNNDSKTINKTGKNACVWNSFTLNVPNCLTPNQSRFSCNHATRHTSLCITSFISFNHVSKSKCGMYPHAHCAHTEYAIYVCITLESGEYYTSSYRNDRINNIHNRFYAADKQRVVQLSCVTDVQHFLFSFNLSMSCVCLGIGYPLNIRTDGSSGMGSKCLRLIYDLPCHICFFVSSQ